MPMRRLYPEIKANRHFHLAVEPPHELYIEECGNPQGLPVLFVHGGPGAGCESWHRSFFDPEIYRIVLFDQRGAGRSRPHAALDINTTPHLVADMERIRVELGIERWVLFGGSWGSTLSLVYAQTHPERVLALILRGIFLCRSHEIQWFYQEGASRIFPDHWQDFLAPIPVDERVDLVRAYHKRLAGRDEIARLQAARAWSVWEGRCATLRPNETVHAFFSGARVALALARIECHYFMHNSFLAPDQILRNAGRLVGIPGKIVHGRYDIVCPFENAFELHRSWPGSELFIIPDAGHAAGEPGITDALVKATDDIARRLVASR